MSNPAKIVVDKLMEKLPTNSANGLVKLNSDGMIPEELYTGGI